MKIAILSLTEGGHDLASRLEKTLGNSKVIKNSGPIASSIKRLWSIYDGLVCIMAAGIVVRSIAPLLLDKRSDPCVVAVDEKGCFAVSLLSGHLGGGNDLAREVAEILGGIPVITTASDTLGLTALDLWARDNGLIAEDKSSLTRACAILVGHKFIRIFSEAAIEDIPADFRIVSNPSEADIVISNKKCAWPGKTVLRPANLVLGIGCNRGTPEEEIEQAVESLFNEHDLSRSSIRNLASIDLKKDEGGLLDFASRNHLIINFYGKDELNKVPGISWSENVMKATGAAGVAEPAALLSAGIETLLIRKQKWKNVTLAVAETPFILSAQGPAA